MAALSAIPLLLLISVSITQVNANLWCYSCVSSQPGCDDKGVDWRIHSAITCPSSDDKCVKIVEKQNDDIQVTRDCLSNLVGQRLDIPEDTFEGCRKSAQPNIAVYVTNDVRQLDLKRNYYKDVEYCFCEFDEWCNSANLIGFSLIKVCTSTFLILCIWWFTNKLII